MTFAAQPYLWLRLVPAALLVLWIFRVLVRRADTRRLSKGRSFPTVQRLGAVGELPFWLMLIVAMAWLGINQPS